AKRNDRRSSALEGFHLVPVELLRKDAALENALGPVRLLIEHMSDWPVLTCAPQDDFPKQQQAPQRQCEQDSFGQKTEGIFLIWAKGHCLLELEIDERRALDRAKQQEH